MTMANRPIAYTLKERKGTVGNLKGKNGVQPKGSYYETCGTSHPFKEVFYTYWRELRTCFST